MPPPFFTSGTINFQAVQAANCPRTSGCEYTITQADGLAHYQGNGCEGDGSAPPWITGPLPSLSLRFTDSSTSPGVYTSLSFALDGELIIPVNARTSRPTRRASTAVSAPPIQHQSGSSGHPACGSTYNRKTDGRPTWS